MATTVQGIFFVLFLFEINIGFSLRKYVSNYSLLGSVLQDGSHLWALALQKRKEGRCPLEPGEVAVMLRAMGYPKETQIYVASGQVYGGQNRMAPLRNMFPNHVSPIA